MGWNFRSWREREGFGGGDPKLFAAPGAWLGLAPLPITLFLAASWGLVAAVLASLSGRRMTGTTTIPFGRVWRWWVGFCGYMADGSRIGLVKLLWYDGQGLCLLSKRLERGHFVWPVTGTGRVSLTQAQLSMLLEGIDWRLPVRPRRPVLAG